MKYLYFLILLSSNSVRAQSQVEDISIKLAEKVKDSLSLSVKQLSRLKDINLELTRKKIAIWQRYGHTDSISYHVQKVENTRDSFYKSIFTEQQFFLYVKRKKHLLNNN